MKVYRNTFVKRNWYLYIPVISIALIGLIFGDEIGQYLTAIIMILFFGSIGLNNYQSKILVSKDFIQLKSFFISKKILLSEATKIDINAAWLLPQICIWDKDKQMISGLNNFVYNVDELKQLISEILEHYPSIKVDFDWNSLVARKGLF